MPFAASSFLFLVEMPGATTSVLAPSSDALVTSRKENRLKAIAEGVCTAWGTKSQRILDGWPLRSMQVATLKGPKERK